MKKVSNYLLALGVAAATLTSCSRSNYAFQPGPAYLGTQAPNASVKMQPRAIAPVAVAAVKESAVPGAPVAAALAPAPAVASRPAAAEAAPRNAAPQTTVATPSATALAAAASTVADSKPAMSRAERKAVRRQASSAAAMYSHMLDSGKSQLVALLLSIFLGTLGIARFYLGYTGRGILMLVLTLLIITAIVSFILNIIDLIKIITGDLKPSGGDYATKL